MEKNVFSALRLIYLPNDEIIAIPESFKGGGSLKMLLRTQKIFHRPLMSSEEEKNTHTHVIYTGYTYMLSTYV